LIVFIELSIVNGTVNQNHWVNWISWQWHVMSEFSLHSVAAHSPSVWWRY